jgi:hypothetical protein
MEVFPIMMTDQTEKESEMPSELISLYDQIVDYTDEIFFFCEGLGGMLSTDYALEMETLNGLKLSAERIKRRCLEIRNRLREICQDTAMSL